MASEKYPRNCVVEIQENDKKQTGRFSRTQTFDFIRAYRQHECLWNVGIPDYNDKAMRYMAIRTLAKEFQLPMEAVKKKIHALRSTYLQMRDRVNEIDNHEPTLSWYYEMEFLDPVITPRKPMELKRIRSKFPRKRMRDDVEISPEEEDNVPQPLQMKIETMPYEETTGHSEQEEVYIEYIEQQREEESCDVVQEEDTEAVYTNVPEPEESSGAASSTAPNIAPAQDEFDIFGQSVAAQLKTMPLMHAIPLMGHIQGLITESRMKSLQATLK
ncbi:uncharacterized protein LOC129790921 [Lutzomyia longipalpis]|uniref:uncharacterized protein LOC129790921 n=1 Tax=Lutzomyia longipalpis TaxID=7200 RepID=UPI002483EA85|nr:uncharacterized protein LOC129790921 [Lutzomyia longipalpis]